MSLVSFSRADSDNYMRKALLKSKGSADRHTQRILQETKGIIFMGTPHCGSGLAEWAVIGSKFLQYFRRLNRSTLEILQQESEVMGRLRQEFHTMLRSRDRSQDKEIAIICFYEELPVRLIGEVDYSCYDTEMSGD